MSPITSPDAPAYEERLIPFDTEDGLTLNLINIRGQKPPHKCPVIVVHGAGVRSQYIPRSGCQKYRRCLD